MTGLHLHRSNRIERLVEVLAESLATEPPSNPFEPVQVVVGSRGMERWLSYRLAERLGVCSNVDFPFPTAALDGIVAGILDEGEGEEGAAEAWSPEVLTWAILEELPGLLERDGFELVRAYLGDASGGRPIAAREEALCRQLADLFDRYVTFRPEMAVDWSAGRSGSGLEEAPELRWQPVLWQAVRERLGQARHRAQRLAAACAALRSGGSGSLPGQPVRVFGVSTLPPVWLDLLAELGRHVRVELYLLCPSSRSWAELTERAAGRVELRSVDRDRLGSALIGPDAGGGPTATRHPLLASMGRVARDFQVVLETAPAPWVEAARDLFEPPGHQPPTALSRLQQDILLDRPGPPEAGDEERLLASRDDSIAVHACYGPTRQVEVLREALLGLLDQHPELEPRDIVVMVPDIASWAPLITAVFSQGASGRRSVDGGLDLGAEGWGPAGAPAIPFEIADLSLRRLNPVADALLRVLEMSRGRVEASSVIDLLHLEPVRLRFGLRSEDLPVLEGWIRDSRVCWGIDADHRREHGQPDDRQNTWLFGLERLLLGVVAADEGDLYFDGVRPFDAMEGGDVSLLGRLVDFCAVLFAELRDLEQARPVEAWVERVGITVERLCATTSAAAWLLRRVRESLRDVQEAARLAGSARDVDLRAIRAVLSGRFDVASAATGQRGGVATFCAMVPMRSVPYKVVALLGMDEDALGADPCWVRRRHAASRQA